jgi:serine/threonine protein kinase
MPRRPDDPAVDPTMTPAPGASDTLPSGAGALGPGTIVSDSYQVTRLLGQGGRGAVWEATHLRLRQGESLASRPALGRLTLDQVTALLTQTSTLIGTPQYMTPEQATGQNDAIDAPTDIFAFGEIWKTYQRQRADGTLAKLAEKP